MLHIRFSFSSIKVKSKCGKASKWVSHLSFSNKGNNEHLLPKWCDNPTLVLLKNEQKNYGSNAQASLNFVGNNNLNIFFSFY